MSRQLEQSGEDKQSRQDKALVRAVQFELRSTIEHLGFSLTGFSVRMDDWETLVTIRAVNQGQGMVSFVGSESLAGALIKAVREGKRDKLVWREDKWSRGK